MNKLLTNKIYHPILYFFLIGFLSLLVGSVLALEFNNFNALALFLFYLFILVNQFIESILLRVPKQDYELSKKILFFSEAMNILLIIFFSKEYSLTAGIILLLYSLMVQFQFLFSYYQLEKTAAFIASFFKVFLVSGFSFYIHLHFIDYYVLFYSLGLFFPYFIYELAKIKKLKLNKSIPIFSFLSYFIAILTLWNQISYFSLLLLLTIPFSLLGSKKINRKNSASFLIVFTLVYSLLLSFSFIL